MVELGRTKVFARIHTNIREPRKERQNEGMFFIRVNLAVLRKENNLPSSMRNMGDEISKVLEQSIKESKALDVESLNIKIGKFCWEIVLELSLVEYDGNLLDAMNYAAMSLLLKYEFQAV